MDITDTRPEEEAVDPPKQQGDGNNEDHPITPEERYAELDQRLRYVEATLDDHHQGFKNLTGSILSINTAIAHLSKHSQTLTSGLSALTKSTHLTSSWGTSAISNGSGLGLLCLGGLLGSMGTSKYFFEQGVDFAARDPTNTWRVLVDGATEAAASVASASASATPSVVAFIPGT
jgi:hypothetical protein